MGGGLGGSCGAVAEDGSVRHSPQLHLSTAPPARFSGAIARCGVSPHPRSLPLGRRTDGPPSSRRVGGGRGGGVTQPFTALRLINEGDCFDEREHPTFVAIEWEKLGGGVHAAVAQRDGRENSIIHRAATITAYSRRRFSAKICPSSIVDGPPPNCTLSGGRPLYGHPGVAHAHAGADK